MATETQAKRREHARENSFAVAIALSAVGGYLDAYTYLAHGGIFANAQTGNFVFMALSVARRDWPAAAKYCAPIIAFFLGVLVVDAATSLAKRRERFFRPAQTVLVIETAILTLMALLPRSVPDVVFSLCVSFAAAMQFAAFGLVGEWNYTSIATTGNLRRLANAVYRYFAAGYKAADAKRATAFGAICLAFFLGVGCGAGATDILVNAAVIVPAIILGTLSFYLARA